MVAPHLSIYKLRWATLSSGCHRLTGFGLWLGKKLFSLFDCRFLCCGNCCCVWMQCSCFDGDHQVPSYHFVWWKVLHVLCSCLSLHLRSETSCRRCRDVVIVVLRLLSGKAHLEEHSEQFSVDHFRCVGFLPVLDRGQASRSEG